MAGLYRQTYKQKQVVKLSPDAVVHINDRPDVEICPICNSKFAISDYLSTITTSLSNNATVGNATFTISIPRHGHNGNYMVRGGRVFGIHLMDEVEIYIKGRFAKDSQGNKDYYKVFWGLVTNIQESYSDGYQNITVSCESILKWLQMMNTNEHPSVQFLNEISTKIDIGSALYTSKIFANLNVYEIIYEMLNITLKNIVIPDGLETELTQASPDGSLAINIIHPKDIELLEYWRKRFSKLKGNLRMFGTSADSFERPRSQAQEDGTRQSSDFSMAASKKPTSPIEINYNSKALLDFRPFFKPDDRKELSYINNSYKNNLEIINEVRLYTGYEFYLDTNGDIIFKPPFWNLDTRNNPIYRIEDSDIISWDFSEDANQVVTRVDVSGEVFQERPTSVYQHPRATFTNWALARQFGIKTEQIAARFFTTKRMCYYHAISEMDRINANRFSASLTIVGRAELRLGYPVYLPSRDVFGYVENISHNFAFAGQFTTQIELSAIRRKYIGDSTVAAQPKFLKENSRSFSLSGKPAILIYERDSTMSDYEIELDVNDPSEISEMKDKTAVPNLTDVNRSRKLSRDTSPNYKTNRNGEYVEYALTDPRAQQVLRDAQKAKDDDNSEAYLNFLEVAIPISDESGYELIGTYENGRSLELTSDNILRKKANSFTEILESTLGGDGNRRAAYNVGVADVTGTVTPSNLGGTVSDKTNRDLRTEREVENFSSVKVSSLRDLSPSSKDMTSCTCYDPSVTSSLASKLQPITEGSRPINQSRYQGGNDRSRRD